MLFNASYGETAWQNFVSDVPSCTQTATSGRTLGCLRRAKSSNIAQALRNSLKETFRPTLDGTNGLIPDYPTKLLARGQFADVPFMAGVNLDEGEELVFLF